MLTEKFNQALSSMATFVAFGGLAAFANAPSATQVVSVPVYASCVKEVPVAPVYEFDKLPLDAPAGEKVLALARDWLHARKYEGMLEAVVAACN